MEPLLTQEMVDPIKSLAVTSKQLHKDTIAIKGIVSRKMGQHCLPGVKRRIPPATVLKKNQL
jgi:hypothetical protein